jgi:ubiquinone/menaquinone biosynthesis C-methylase UbiE
MATKAPDPSTAGTNFASPEIAEQWRGGRELRDEVSGPATEMMVDLVNIQVGDRVLEIAAGTGDLAIMIARRVGSNGYVLTTDIAASMLNLAAEAAREAGFTNVETRVMNAEEIDLAVDSFNAALCRSALMHFPNPAKALAGVYRVLKPSSKCAVAVFSTEEKNPYHGLPLSIASRLAKMPLAAPGQPGMFALSGRGVLEDCYRKAGFRNVAVEAVPVRRHFPSTTEAIRAMKGSFPRLQNLMAKLSDTDRELAWNEIEQQLSQFEGSSGFEAPGEWLIGVGTKSEKKRDISI